MDAPAPDDASPFAFMMPPGTPSNASDTDGDPEPEPARFRPGTSRPPTATAAPLAFFSARADVQQDAAAQGASLHRPSTSRGPAPVSPPPAFPLLASVRLSTSTGPPDRPLTSASRPQTRVREQLGAQGSTMPTSPTSAEGLAPAPLVSLNKNGRSTAEEEMRARMIREELEEDSDEEDLTGVFAFMRPLTPLEPIHAHELPSVTETPGVPTTTTSPAPKSRTSGPGAPIAPVASASRDPLNASAVTSSSPTRPVHDLPHVTSSPHHPTIPTLPSGAPHPSYYFDPWTLRQPYEPNFRRPHDHSPSSDSAILPSGAPSHDLGTDAAAGPSLSYGSLHARTKEVAQTADANPTTDESMTSLKEYRSEAYPMSEFGTMPYRSGQGGASSDGKGDPPVRLSGPRPADFVYEAHRVRKRRPQMVVVENTPGGDSPYIEVRCSVQSDDDTTEACNTMRVWVIAFVLITLTLAANTYWTFRSPSPTFTVPLIVLFTWPAGRAWARYMPNVAIPLPQALFGPGAKLEVNPGAWTMKEHALVSQLGMVTINSYITYPIYMLTTIDNKFLWDHSIKGGSFLYGLLLSWSAAFFGIAMAGVASRFLVQAASTIWPHNLSISLLINILHAEEDPPPGELGRVQYFKLLLSGTFFWQWIPTYVFTGLSVFNWICWVAPKSVVANHLFGYHNGLSLLPITLDWAQVSTFSSPLIPPWWTGLNLLIAYVFFWIFLGTILVFTNSLNMGYLPMLGGGMFDKYGHTYDISRVLDHPHGQLSEENISSYSPLYVSYGYYMMYYAGLAMPMALLVHFVLHHHSSLVHAIKFGKPEKDDIHAKLMARYPQVPTWIYFFLFPVAFAVAAGTVRGLNTGMPIYSVLVAFGICSVFFLPAGIVFAQTNLFMTFTNTLCELVAGYMHPGSASVNILFKTVAITSNNVGILFAAGMKMGHYLKVPPRVTFVAQTLFVLWAFTVQFAVKAFFHATVHDLCSPKQINGMVCPGAQTAYSSSLAWGTIGPQRMFGSGGQYKSLYWSMLAGALLPLPIWLLNKRFKMAQFVSAPILLLGATFIPSYQPIAVVAYILPNFITQWYIRRRSFKFWDRYQYITSAALDAGATLASLAIFFCLQLPKHGEIQLNWAGNEVYTHNRDYKGIPWLQVPPNGFL